MVVTGVAEEGADEDFAYISSSKSDDRTPKLFLSISGISPALFPDGKQITATRTRSKPTERPCSERRRRADGIFPGMAPVFDGWNPDRFDR